MMRLASLFLGLFLLAANLVDPSLGRAGESVVIPGTGDSQELLRVLATAFGKKHPGVVIEIPESIGSSGGIKAVIAGQAPIARVARLPKEKEPLHHEVFAYSPVVFAASGNIKGVKTLTFPQVVAIYGGKIANWKELGGPDGAIYVMNREEGDSSRTMLEAIIPGFKEIAPVGEKIYTTPEAVKTIRTYPNTIGYVPLPALRGTGLVSLAINGVTPRDETVHDGRYPLVIPLGFVWKEEPRGAVREFLLFIKSRAGQELLRANGVVPTAKP